eukprot:gb/GECH01000084.1/.p1 GENE.gb/GECH01000084.1/~~gb/GECH01000084.1/.p1  ORF type:complete len:184 (+),score=41.58 gb/GECH01000084.1/:1-552(+)
MTIKVLVIEKGLGSRGPRVTHAILNTARLQVIGVSETITAEMPVLKSSSGSTLSDEEMIQVLASKIRESGSTPDVLMASSFGGKLVAQLWKENIYRGPTLLIGATLPPNYGAIPKGVSVIFVDEKGKRSPTVTKVIDEPQTEKSKVRCVDLPPVEYNRLFDIKNKGAGNVTTLQSLVVDLKKI